MQLFISEPLLEVLDRMQGAADAVLVEAVAPVGAAKKQPVYVYFSLSGLRSNRLPGVHRVLVVNSLNNVIRMNLTVIVQGHAVLILRA
jgi:hypothetical protein